MSSFISLFVQFVKLPQNYLALSAGTYRKPQDVGDFTN